MKSAMILNYFISVLKSFRDYKREDQKAIASFQMALVAFQQSHATERLVSPGEQETKNVWRKEREGETVTFKVKEEVA